MNWSRKGLKLGAALVGLYLILFLPTLGWLALLQTELWASIAVLVILVWQYRKKNRHAAEQ